MSSPSSEATLRPVSAYTLDTVDTPKQVTAICSFRSNPKEVAITLTVQSLSPDRLNDVWNSHVIRFLERENRFPDEVSICATVESNLGQQKSVLLIIDDDILDLLFWYADNSPTTMNDVHDKLSPRLYLVRFERDESHQRDFTLGLESTTFPIFDLTVLMRYAPTLRPILKPISEPSDNTSLTKVTIRIPTTACENVSSPPASD